MVVFRNSLYLTNVVQQFQKNEAIGKVKYGLSALLYTILSILAIITVIKEGQNNTTTNPCFGVCTPVKKHCIKKSLFNN